MAQNQENEFYNGDEEEIDINKLNELEKEKFEKDFLSIISYKDSNDSPIKKNIVKRNEYIPLSSLTSASGDENPISKFMSLKSKIDSIEKEINLYSENADLINSDKSMENCLIKLKKIKEAANFISQSKNFMELKKIIDEQKLNKTEKLENFAILQKKMNENLNMHLINRANIISRLKAENPDDFNNLDYQLFVTPETKKLKKLSKIIEIKKKLENIKNLLGEWDMEQNKKNLVDTINELKMDVNLSNIKFKKEVEKQKDIIAKRVKEMEKNDEFYNAIDKEYIDDLFTGFQNSQEIENIITETINKMESLKEGHEVSAYVGLQLQEMIEQQEKLGNEINNNSQILINLKKNIKNNIEIMRKNIELLKAKINNIK